jgi:hypothetical protein
MRMLKIAGAAALAVATLGASAAGAQPGWAPPPTWGPGWNHWEGHNYGHRWAGPAYYTGEGEHHGWYHWHNAYYQNCGWRWSHHHHEREWNCY